MNNINIEQISKNPYYAIEVRSDVGNRTEQQDQAYIHISKENIFAVVCDGMGGILGGGLASKTAISSIQHSYRDYLAGEAEDCPSFLYQAMRTADRAVKVDRNAGGTTMVAIMISHNQLYWASVGDSRLYIMRSKELLQVTRDHNYCLQLDEMLKRKQIQPGWYGRKADRGEALISYIGKGEIGLYDLTQAGFILHRRDALLLTTDGLFKSLSHDELSNIISSNMSTPEKSDFLLRCAQSKSEENMRDNTTFVMIDIL